MGCAEAESEATTSGFASDCMNRPWQLLPGVGMNGRRAPSYGGTMKNSHWNRSVHSRGGGAGIGCYSGCFSCSSFEHYSQAQQEYIICSERL